MVLTVQLYRFPVAKYYRGDNIDVHCNNCTYICVHLHDIQDGPVVYYWLMAIVSLPGFQFRLCYTINSHRHIRH